MRLKLLRNLMSPDTFERGWRCADAAIHAGQDVKDLRAQASSDLRPSEFTRGWKVRCDSEAKKPNNMVGEWVRTEERLPCAEGEQVQILMWSSGWATWIHGMFTNFPEKDGGTPRWCCYDAVNDRFDDYTEPEWWALVETPAWRCSCGCEETWFDRTVEHGENGKPEGMKTRCVQCSKDVDQTEWRRR